MLKVASKTAFEFVKKSIYISGIIPPPLSSSKLVHNLHNVLKLCTMISWTLYLIPVFTRAYAYRQDMTELPECVTLVSASLYELLKVPICHVYQRQYQTIIRDIDEFIKGGDSLGKEILQKHIDKLFKVYFFTTISSYSSVAVFDVTPLLSPGVNFPAKAIYPFRVDVFPMRQIVYMHHVTCGFQFASAMCMDNLIGFILWYCSTRLQVLSAHLRIVKNFNDFRKCIREHQYLLRLLTEVVDMIQYVLLTNFFISLLGVIFGAVYIFTPQSFMVKLQYALVCSATYFTMFCYCWSADCTSEMTSLVGYSLYESDWTRLSPNLVKNWLFTIQKTQRPVSISVKPLIKEINLKFYGSVLYMTFSYFTALHTILIDNNEVEEKYK